MRKKAKKKIILGEKTPRKKSCYQKKKKGQIGSRYQVTNTNQENISNIYTGYINTFPKVDSAPVGCNMTLYGT